MRMSRTAAVAAVAHLACMPWKPQLSLAEWAVGGSDPPLLVLTFLCRSPAATFMLPGQQHYVTEAGMPYCLPGHSEHLIRRATYRLCCCGQLCDAVYVY